MRLSSFLSGVLNTKKVFFVGGAARSGTTLLQSILCSDDTTNPLMYEAAPFRFLFQPYVSLKNHYNKYPGIFFESLEDLNNLFNENLNLFLDSLRSKYSCENLVLKEPELTKLFTLLAEILVDAKFVCTVRDPRAAISSMIQWGERASLRGEKHFFQNRDMAEMTRFYNEFYIPLFKSENPDFDERLRFVRYEDLVNQPNTTVDELRGFTGLKLEQFNPRNEWSKNTIDFSDPNLPIRDAITDLYGKPISTSRLDAYKSVLTEEEIRTIEGKCSTIFNEFGYIRLPRSKETLSPPDVTTESVT